MKSKTRTILILPNFLCQCEKERGGKKEKVSLCVCILILAGCTFEFFLVKDSDLQ